MQSVHFFRYDKKRLHADFLKQPVLLCVLHTWRRPQNIKTVLKHVSVCMHGSTVQTSPLTKISYTSFHLTHWGRVTHICVGNLTIIGPDNGLSPDRRQAIIWTNAGILLIGPWGTNFSEISIDIHTFSFKKINLKMSSVKWCPFCLGLNVLKNG